MMNAGIETNGQELDSGFLKIIFNFEIFFREGLDKGKDAKNKVIHMIHPSPKFFDTVVKDIRAHNFKILF